MDFYHMSLLCLHKIELNKSVKSGHFENSPFSIYMLLCGISFGLRKWACVSRGDWAIKGSRDVIFLIKVFPWFGDFLALGSISNGDRHFLLMYHTLRVSSSLRSLGF